MFCGSNLAHGKIHVIGGGIANGQFLTGKEAEFYFWSVCHVNLVDAMRMRNPRGSKGDLGSSEKANGRASHWMRVMVVVAG